MAFGIIAATLAGFQTAAILAQQPTVAPTPMPLLAKGGIIKPTPGGTPTIIGEAGIPEAVIPLDQIQTVISNVNPSSQYSTPGALDDGDIYLTVKIDSKPILEKIFPATRNRQVLIDARSIVS